MRVVRVMAMGIALCGCGQSKTSTSPGRPAETDSGAPIPSSVPTSAPNDARAPGASDASSPSDAGGCEPAPPWPTPKVLSGELESVVLHCGQNGNPPTLVGPVPPTNRMDIAIGFIGKAAELALFANEVSDPASPYYRHYLTPEEVTARFGPSVCNYQAMIDWLEAGGLRVVTTYPDRFLIDANGTVAQLDALMHVTLNEYQRPDGTMFYAPDRDPSVTLGVAIAISGLDDCYVSTPAGAIDAGGRD